MKKGKKKKESEKPDTFVEKLAVHLTKNLQVEFWAGSVYVLVMYVSRYQVF